MRTVVLFACISVNFILNAQVKVGALIQPALNYLTVQSEYTSLNQDFKQTVKPVINLNGGFILSKDLGNSTTFITGLLFTQRGLRSQFNTSTITAFDFSNSGNDIKLTDRYLEIPVLLNVYFRKAPFISFFGTFGLKPAFYINSVRRVVGQKKASNYVYQAHRKLNLFAVIGAGAEFKWNDKTSVLLWPTLDHALISEVYASPLKLFPYSAGINLCLIYSLGN